MPYIIHQVCPWKRGTALAAILGPVSMLSAASLTVQWDDNSRSELGFKVERSTNGKTFTTVATVRANQTSYTDSTVAPATTYWYRVKAYDLLRSSGYSNITSAKTPAKPASSGTGTTKPPATKPAPAAPKPTPAPSTPVVTKPTPSAPAPAKPATGTPGTIKAFTARSITGSADPQSLILTFTVTGTSRSTLLRGIGPGLVSYTSAKTLPDPKLKLSSGSTALGSNDNWGGGTSLTSLFKQAGAFPIPGASKDAAMWRIIGAGNYTSVVNGASSGLAQIELYDVDTSSAPTGRFAKLSVRAPVQTGSGVLVGGFVIGGKAPVRLLIRAMGPAVTGVSGVLKDPQLSIHRGSTAVASNNDWGGGSALASAFKQVGAASLPTSSKDAALLVTLSPGSYTATVSGVSNTVGIARLELFVMP